ncbi:hypothetical protein YTPLAS72_19470 [Nitrospira sp.]|nr:hypothetical protein YTPLAS72_19470 [Nitrospira sp.]
MASGTFPNLLSDGYCGFQGIPGRRMPFSPIFCKSKHAEAQSYQVASDTSKGGAADQSVLRLISLRKGVKRYAFKGFHT